MRLSRLTEAGVMGEPQHLKPGTALEVLGLAISYYSVRDPNWAMAVEEVENILGEVLSKKRGFGESTLHEANMGEVGMHMNDIVAMSLGGDPRNPASWAAAQREAEKLEYIIQKTTRIRKWNKKIPTKVFQIANHTAGFGGGGSGGASRFNKGRAQHPLMFKNQWNRRYGHHIEDPIAFGTPQHGGRIVSMLIELIQLGEFIWNAYKRFQAGKPILGSDEEEEIDPADIPKLFALANQEAAKAEKDKAKRPSAEVPETPSATAPAPGTPPTPGAPPEAQETPTTPPPTPTPTPTPPPTAGKGPETPSKVTVKPEATPQQLIKLAGEKGKWKKGMDLPECLDRWLPID